MTHTRWFILLLIALLLSVPLSAQTAVVQLPKTGQTGCWDAGGSVVACAGTGQDGNKLSGVAWPTSRFNDNANGTVTDNLTGLIWLKNANCFNSNTWLQALSAANTLASGACNLTDNSVAGNWRLPNVNELESLIDLQNINPALPTQNAFGNVQSQYYWTSSTFISDKTTAIVVGIGNGSVVNGVKGNSYYIWPVRSGP